MGDDIDSGSICYCFSLNLPSAAQFVFKGQKTTLKDNLSHNPNQCHHPLITQLTLDSKNLLLFSFVRELWASRIVCRNDELSFIMFY